ncbi:glycosyl hydrolase [Rhodocollybia butyracea]|uniref:Glycosyl hydrolase n=1 Tax=Rhodocollybia butyracea TaxID=206335 RepID=A0A9P5QAE4_9AGAR|nr:glycosyl hydrolase [Rhodocollybia butyracea]
MGFILRIGTVSLALVSLAAASLSKRDYSLPWRPQVHFTPPQDWMNDPNGLFRDASGLWHMYYQYADTLDPGNDKSWGSATSENLLAWTNLPIAINDISGVSSIWSGSAVIDSENTSGLFPNQTNGVVAFYTSWTSTKQSQFMAYSSDNGLTFTNYPGNPVIDLNITDFRDPKVLFYAPTNSWILVVSHAVDGFIAFYRSTDLKVWTQVSTFSHPAIQGVLECPQFITIPLRENIWDPNSTILDVMYMLAISDNSQSTVKYVPGNFDGTTFTPVSSFPVATGGIAQSMDFGIDSYATAFYYGLDPTGNVVSTSWAVNLGYSTNVPTSSEGWESAMSIPRNHFLVKGADDAYFLATLPVDVSSMRETTPVSFPALGNSQLIVDYSAIDSRVIEFYVTVSTPQVSDNITTVLEFSSSATGENVQLQLTIPIAESPTNRISAFTMSRAGITGWTNNGNLATEFTVPNVGPFNKTDVNGVTTETYEFHGVIDRTILDVFLNGGINSGTMIFFPQESNMLDTMTLTVGGIANGSLSQVSLEAWGLKSGWEALTGESAQTGSQLKVVSFTQGTN